ncbi:carbon-nitrogen hydrolase family protein [Candidatus Acetothermia bacterium]|nr:carbon-nitrogen hydrolase family protein [Candidatus Acetothermia bacterium]
MSLKFPKYKVAAVQAEPVLLDLDASLEKAIKLIEAAADEGAELIVFPEAFLPIYPFWTAFCSGGYEYAPLKKAYARLYKNSVEIPGSETRALGQAARKAKAIVVMGVNERDIKHSGTLYNTIIYFGKAGEIFGTHRKLVPTYHERMIWGRGDGTDLKVYETELGRIGGLICWENFMPLARYALYAQGVQIYVAPTADDTENWLAAMQHIAFENRMYVIPVSPILKIDSLPKDFELRKDLEKYKGKRMQFGTTAIIGPNGKFLAGPLWNDESILYAEIDLEKVYEERSRFDPVGHYGRPDVFELYVNGELCSTLSNVLETVPAKMSLAENGRAKNVGKRKLQRSVKRNG